jgi:hypothetical protein
MIKSLGQLRERKWSAGHTSTAFFNNVNSAAPPLIGMYNNANVKNKNKNKVLNKSIFDNSHISKGEGIKVNFNIGSTSPVIKQQEVNTNTNTNTNMSLIERDSLEMNEIYMSIGKGKKINLKKGDIKNQQGTCCGSPAIWMRNQKRTSEEKDISQNKLSTSRSISKIKLNEISSRTRNASNNKENEMFFHINKNGPVLLKLHKAEEDEDKQISLYSKQPSFMVVKNKNNNILGIDSNYENSFTTSSNENEFKSLIFRTRHKVKGHEKKFSNINQGSKISTIDNGGKSEIDEVIVRIV